MNEEQGKARTCAKCGSRHVMENIGLLAYPQGGGVKACTSRIGFLNIPMSTYADITACVCADCGHTELVTENLADLWKVYSENHR